MNREKGELFRIGFNRRKIFGSPSQRRRIFFPDRFNKLSIGRIDGLNCEQIFNLALDFAATSSSPEPIHGWYEFSEDAVHDADLAIDYDDTPERHAHIVSWPKNLELRALAIQKLCKACYRIAQFESAATINEKVDNACEHVRSIESFETLT